MESSDRTCPIRFSFFVFREPISVRSILNRVVVGSRVPTIKLKVILTQDDY